MPSIFVKDDLRASVEAATGGKMTMLYTATGQPCYMNVIPKFNLQDIDPAFNAGVHPAFVVNGVEKNELFIGTYQGIIKNGELLSLPGVDPSMGSGATHDAFVAAARSNGPGWHMISNTEWAALALWCWKNGFQPRGNSNWGKSSDAAWETGRRVDGVLPGTVSGTGRTLTGSGPASWRHDNTFSGVSDLNGNVSELVSGLRIVAGEIQVIANNDCALATTDMSATSAAWRAIDGATGALVAPTFTGTIAGGTYAPTTPNSVRLAINGTANYTLVRASGSTFEGMTNPGVTPVAAAALEVLKRYGLYPVAATGLGSDNIVLDLTGERMAIRGGSWTQINSGSGIFALIFQWQRSYADWNIGSRVAFVQ